MRRPKEILYLGLDPGRYPHNGNLVHLPTIKILPRPFVGPLLEAFSDLDTYTYVLLTSRTAANMFKEYAIRSGYAESDLNQKKYLCIGQATAMRLHDVGLHASYTAETQTAEGVVTMMERLTIAVPLFFPHSAQGRTLIHQYLIDKKIPFKAVPLYDTLTNHLPIPPLEQFDEIVFTSPSTVKAFFQLTTQTPPLEKCKALGPQTEKFLVQFLSLFYPHAKRTPF